MDALSDVLRAVQLAGAVFLDAEFRAPWCVGADSALMKARLPAVEHVISYHYVAAGRCRARVVGGEPIWVEAGQVVVFPQGDAHEMASAPQLAPTAMAAIFRPPGAGALARLQYGGDGAATRVVCGFLACDPRLCRPMLAALPRMMAVDLRSGPSGRWLDASIEQSLVEASSARPGGEVVLARLSELLFVETLRRHIEALAPENKGWFAGLRDPMVGKGLALMHGGAARPWTVETLAREVGCSRSVLAERFTGVLGQPPMRYLARWRLALAASLLRAGDTRLARVAAQVGYESEAAFNRAFKREYGLSPERWRRSGLNAPAACPR